MKDLKNKLIKAAENAKRGAVATIVITASMILCGTSFASSITAENTLCVTGHQENPDIEDFIRMLYNEYVFGGKDFAPIARKYCTPKLRKQLSDAYDYDCYDGDCYASWLFRTGVQDYVDDIGISKITQIYECPNGWYCVNFIDMGNGGCARIKFVECNGSFKMDEIENLNYKW